MFGILIGAFGSGLLSKWFKDEKIMFGNSSDDKVDGVFMKNYIISNEMYNVIKEHESFQPKAYVVEGESFYTIGYGSTRIFSADGKTSRAVRKDDVLTKDQAIFQMKMYYNRPGSVKLSVDKVIESTGVKLHQRFYDMICQIAYGSGGFHKSSKFVDMLNKANGSTDLNYLAGLILNRYIEYVKGVSVKTKAGRDYIYFPNKNRRKNKGGYGLGWSRRAYSVTQYILGGDYSQLNAYNKIKKPY